MFAGAIFLKIAAAHDHHFVIFVLVVFMAAQIEPIDLGIPKMKNPTQGPLRFSDHDVVAAIAPLLAFPNLLIGRRDEPAGKFLHRDIEQDKGEEKKADRPTDPARDPLPGDA